MIISESIQSAGAATSRVFIIDSHPLARTGLAHWISRQPDLSVAGEADPDEDAIQQIDSLRPDLVTVDSGVKRSGGVNLIQQIDSLSSGIKTLVVSHQDNVVFAERAMRAGAHGFVHKRESPEVVIGAIQEVLKGKKYFSKSVQERLHTASGASAAEPAKPGPFALSGRETEVLSMIGQGLSTRQVACQLNLSVNTIETYREKLKLKLKLKNAAELWRFAVQWVMETS